MDIIEIFKRFPTQDHCLDHLETVWWAGKPICPYCNSNRVSSLKSEHRHHCNNCNTSFSVTVSTIFHNTKLPLQKWFLAVALTLNAKNGLSARQLARQIRVNKDTAWRITMKIRDAMAEDKQRTLLSGLVEADETYISGKPRKGKPGPKPKRGRGTKKTPVVGLIERGGRMVAEPVKKKDLTHKRLSALVRQNVDINNTVLITDEFGGYVGIKHFMPYETVNHQIWYVDGHKHTNSIESFWALLKRGIVGQYHKVSLRYLPRCISEFTYRFNHRERGDLFDLTIARALGV